MWFYHIDLTGVFSFAYLSVCFVQTHSGSVWRVTWAHPEFGQVLASCSFDRTAAVWEEIVGESNDKQRGLSHWVSDTVILFPDKRCNHNANTNTIFLFPFMLISLLTIAITVLFTLLLFALIWSLNHSVFLSVIDKENHASRQSDLSHRRQVCTQAHGPYVDHLLGRRCGENL